MNIAVPIAGLCIIGFWVLIYFLVRKAWRSYKKFRFDLIDHANDTIPHTGANRNDYTYEAWKAYEDVTQKRKQDTTPPWEN